MPSGKPLNAAYRDRIASYITKHLGSTDVEIGRACGVTRDTVRSVRRSLGMFRTGHNDVDTYLQVQQACEAYLSVRNPLLRPTLSDSRALFAAFHKFAGPAPCKVWRRGVGMLVGDETFGRSVTERLLQEPA
jgi:hypothetical protein